MQLEALTKALSDQTRLRIVMLLTGHGELCVCDLTEVLGLAQPKISRHLAILRDCQLLQARKQGQWVHYSVHDGLPEWAKVMLQSLHQGAQQEDLYREDAQRLLEEGGQWQQSCRG